ncbi:MAG: 50S ribosomal protein L11 methyltransferase [Cellulophaga sp.]|uniref:50S ribosomal protein L11 methyltransferase n=1 Tax=unclassified Cellulophaga TaxID=2634405 RepID=UPI0026E31B35|nr:MULTISPECIES: 50S ribosomal protein L11 methyltransferase [unclassified Cellulophaga]MDO6492347.1 50S ribosomal protein L11 methyltransferase [Cellulophaga sp. 2_MG-2023]MDO6496153.1 50S ribosomal protein L11 methyltransferase [Cellulophaga sp. 3_MG-2023]
MADLVYIEYNFNVTPLQPASDILIAQLGEVGFDSFVENEEGVQAYILKDLWTEENVKNVQILSNENFDISFNFKEIEQQNWNAEWEKNFEKIVVDDVCTVRAPFHEKPNTKFDIVIEPKMSFGTGHHETTHMMLQHILEHDFTGKSVLDMGSGTGVLAILAAMKNAGSIDAIDIDNWCYLNALENKERNNCSQINVFEGDVSLLKDQKYNIIIANINRNILLADIPEYAKCLTKDGILFLSGFYKEDIPVITEKCNEVGLKFEKNLEKNNWVAVKYVF